MHKQFASRSGSTFGPTVCKGHQQTALAGRANFSACIIEYIYQIGADLGPELQCLLRVKEDLRLVLIFQDVKYNV